MIIDDYLSMLNILDIFGIQYKKALKLSDTYIHKMKMKYINQYGYTLIGRGSYRIGFELNSDWIIKFPLNSSGVRCNLVEAKLYEIYKNTGRYAKCCIKDYHGIPLIVMESIKDFYEEHTYDSMNDLKYPDLPHWCHHQDGPQIGYNKKGKLKIYDYGNCVDELKRHKDFSKKFLTMVKK